MEQNEVKRKCTNCAFHQVIKHGIGYVPFVAEVRCWEHPDVVDHARVVSMEKAEKSCCEMHMFEDEWKDRKKEEDREDYVKYRKKIVELEEKYPEFKEIEI